ncbi:MAG: haloacid dehalogenase-like hydrolase [Candidatus Diapherotrites archaeon]|nr:haloacid dehalogenase-like hydrolase [Candidatus Diapherotrites archaeon]
MASKAVFSDIDGTLSSGFITVDFIRHLAEKGILKKEPFGRHERLMQSYKEGKIKYIDLVPKWSRSVADCLDGLPVEEAKRLARDFFEEWKGKNIYKSTKPLVKLLHEKDYLFLLISAGWEELAGLFAEEIGADSFSGMKIRTSNTKITNFIENELYLEKGKAEEIQALIKKYGIDREKTMGMGDSIQDKAIFENVKKPIALNPSKELLAKAEKKGWYIGTHENVLEMMENCFKKEVNRPSR